MASSPSLYENDPSKFNHISPSVDSISSSALSILSDFFGLETSSRYSSAHLHFIKQNDNRFNIFEYNPIHKCNKRLKIKSKKPLDSLKNKKSTLLKIDFTNEKLTVLSNQSIIQRPTKNFKRSDSRFKLTSHFLRRLDNYWNIIQTNNNYNNLMINSMVKFEIRKSQRLNPSFFISNIIPSLLPNNITINFFKLYQGINGWHYEKSFKRLHQNNNELLPMRWCNQQINFYDPFVSRYQLDESGKKINKQNLCPYCPFNVNIKLNNVFFSTIDSLYKHHVCKDHGIYTSGCEMSPPMFISCKDIPMVCCTECGELCKMKGLGSYYENCMISYYKHAFNSHNKKRQKNSLEQNKKDKNYSNTNDQPYIYESSYKFIPKRLQGRVDLKNLLFLFEKKNFISTNSSTNLESIENSKMSKS